MTNIIGLNVRETQTRERYPEFQFQINYTIEGADPDTVTGFLTGMGNVYFIGTGLKPTEHEPSEVDWVWSAPMDHVRSIKALGPTKTTTKLDA